MIVTKEKQEIINEILIGFEYTRHFETDDFLYWVKESFTYDGFEVSKEEFENIKNYAIKHGKLPSEELKERLSKIIKSSDKEANIFNVSNREKNINTGTYSHQRMMRYSKKYDNLEIYDSELQVRSSTRMKSDRVLCMRKRTKILSINSKNFVLLGGKRWLSLKNWAGFINKAPMFITQDVVKMLLKLMIGERDWIKELEDSIYISNKNSRKANTLDEAIKYECGAKPAKAIKRALLDNTNDIINLYSLIDHKQIHSLTNFIKQNHDTLDAVFKSPANWQVRSENLLFLYFLVKDNRCDRGIFSDYISMLKQEGKRINLNISSYTTIKRNHDEISREILEKNRDKTRLKIAKHYLKIDSVPGIEVEMIKSAKRLSQESEMLNHCVHSYKTSINKGDCAIYSLVHKEERYTFEVRAKRLPKEKEEDEERFEFNASQLRGKYNCNPPASMEKPLLELCIKNDIETKNKIISFKDKEVKIAGQPIVKTEIKQIGVAILDTLIRPKQVNQPVRAMDEDLPF